MQSEHTSVRGTSIKWSTDEGDVKIYINRVQTLGIVDLPKSLDESQQLSRACVTSN